MTLSSAPETVAVQHALRGSVLVVTIDHAPVNALNADVRRGLIDAIETADANAAVRAVLIVGAGRNFIAGADIREFGKPAVPPSLPEVCNRIEACSKPVVAAIHGAALGGGLEVALASHYRIAVEGAKLGLPEVQLGLLPGAGGTQRSARLIGAQAALSLMLSGRHAGAQEALRLGLVDRVGQSDDVFAEGLAYTHELIATHAAPRRTKNAHGLVDKEASAAAIAAARADTQKKSRGLLSPLKIVDCVEAALNLPFDEGLRFERERFLECRESPQRAGLVHAFFAEREAQKSPETRDAKPRAIRVVGVIGGGTMGAGIAVALLDAGLAVTMIERDGASLERGRAHVEKVYDGLIAKGRMTRETKAGALQRFKGDTTYDATRPCATSVFRWDRIRSSISPAAISAGPHASAAPRRAIRMRATCASATSYASAAGSARRRDAASIATKTARVPARRMRKSKRSSTPSACVRASSRARSTTSRSCAATWPR